MLTAAPTEVILTRTAHRTAQSRRFGPIRALHLLPLVVAIASGAWGAGSRQVWLDEYATWWASSLSWRNLWRLLGHIDTVQGPYYALIHIWIGVFGDSPLAMRAPSVIATVAAVACTTAIGTRLYSRWTGIIAGLILACVPFVALYGQTARPYAIAVALAAASSLQILRALDAPHRKGRWVLYGLALLGLGAMHLVSLLVLVAHGAAVFRYAWSRPQDRRQLLVRWVTPAAASLLMLSPLILRGHAQSFQIGGGANDANQAVYLITYAFWSKISAVIIVWFAVLGASLVHTEAHHRSALIAWAVFPYLFVIPTIPLLNLADLRYLLFAVPPWAVLAAAAIAHIAPSTTSVLRWTMPAGLALALACAIPGNVDVRHDPYRGYPDYERAVQEIAGRIQAGDGIAFGGLYSPGSRRIAMVYGLRHNLLQPRYVLETAPPETTGWYNGDSCEEPEVCALAAGRIWLVTTTTLPDPFSQTGVPVPRADGLHVYGARAGAYLRTHYDIAGVKQFERVRVLLLTRKP